MPGVNGLGINLDPQHEGFTAEQIANYDYVRFPLWQDLDQAPYRMFITGAKNLGITVLAVCDYRTLIEPKGKSYRYKFERLRDMYGDLIDYWQIGNEPDLESPSSWTLSPRRCSTLLHIASEVLFDKFLIMGGLASGQPDWLKGVGRLPVDAIAIHPYTKAPDNWAMQGWETGRVNDILNMYMQYGLPIWVTEFGAEDGLFDDVNGGTGSGSREEYYKQMVHSMRNRPCFAFCWDDAMVPGYGINGKFELV